MLPLPPAGKMIDVFNLLFFSLTDTKFLDFYFMICFVFDPFFLSNIWCRGRICSVLEGGYDISKETNALAKSVVAHVESLSEVPHQ